MADGCRYRCLGNGACVVKLVAGSPGDINQQPEQFVALFSDWLLILLAKLEGCLCGRIKGCKARGSSLGTRKTVQPIR